MRTSQILIIFGILFVLGETSKSDELETLQSNFEAAKKRAIAPIEDRYNRELDSLKKKAITRGDLEMANRVDAVARFSKFSGLWRAVGKDSGPKEIKFLADNKGTSSFDHSGAKKHQVEWFVFGDRIVVLRGGNSLILRISKNGDSLEGNVWDGKQLKMKRI